MYDDNCFSPVSWGHYLAAITYLFEAQVIILESFVFNIF